MFGAPYGDQYVKRELIIHGSDEVLEWSPPWELERLEHFARVGGATISISGDPNPDVFADLDGVRVGKARPKALRRAVAADHLRGQEHQLDDRRVSERALGRARSTARPTSTVSGRTSRRAVRLDETDPGAGVA